MPTRIDTGIRAIDRKLNRLATREANKIARSALNAGLGDLVKAIRREIDAASISADLKKSLKLTVGKRLETSPRRGMAARAKAGLGVGKNIKAKMQRQAKRQGKRAAKGRRGVGISANNVQWFALGTRRRFTASGHATGQLNPVEVVPRAGRSAGGSLKSTVEAKARERMDAIVRSL